MRFNLNKRKLYRTSLLIIFLVAFVGFACAIPGLPGEGTPGLPTQEPDEPTSPPIEPTQPPVEPTQPPVEPTAPSEIEPTAPVGGEVPPQGGDSSSSETLITLLFWLLVLVVIILGIALIVSLFTGRKKEPASQTVAPESEVTPSYAETSQETQGAQPVPGAAVVSALENISPQVAPLYDRFVNLLQGLGPVTILPTQTRVDFQRRIIFASLQFSQEDMRLQMLLPQSVDAPRMVRIEVFSDDKVAHTIVLRTTDDFDAHFTAWLQDSYELGG
jgi:hypothetical protein